MTADQSGSVTGMLEAAGQGDKAAIGQLYGMLYPELRSLAHQRVRNHNNLQMLDTTSLVHESYLRLVKAGRINVENRKHFLAYAAHVMRSVVVDFVRHARTERQGGAELHVTLNSDVLDGVASPADEILRMHEFLEELAQVDQRLVSVIEMRYFAALDNDQIAEVLGVTDRTVRRDLEKARLLLLDALLVKRDAAEIAELSRLIDAALELPAEQRPTWIEQLPSEHDTLKPALRKLLAMPPAGNNTYTLSDVSQQVHVAMQGAAGAAESLEFKEGARVGPYELIRELGRGGMGTVWLARRTEGLTRRVVALKLPHPGMLHAEFAARMGRERDILESLAHPNIARLYDAGVTPAGQPYLALEYVEGVPLNVYCDKQAPGAA